MKKAKLILPVVGISAVASAVIPLAVSCQPSADMLRNEMLGGCWACCFDACARQPEARSKLEEIMDLFIDAFEKTNNINRLYGLGSLGGANNGNVTRYQNIADYGVFDACARQPELIGELKTLTIDTIDRILGAKKGIYGEMIGLGASSLTDAIARQPELRGKLLDYADYISSSINKVKDKDDAISIGVASVDFFDACARQPDLSGPLFDDFKEYIETLIK